jgi:hypothetical protein
MFHFVTKNHSLKLKAPVINVKQLNYVCVDSFFQVQVMLKYILA